MGSTHGPLSCSWSRIRGAAGGTTQRLTRSRYRCMQVVEQLRKRGDKRQEARALNCLALMHSQALNMHKAIPALQRCLPPLLHTLCRTQRLLQSQHALRAGACQGGALPALHRRALCLGHGLPRCFGARGRCFRAFCVAVTHCHPLEPKPAATGSSCV